MDNVLWLTWCFRSWLGRVCWLCLDVFYCAGWFFVFVGRVWCWLLLCMFVCWFGVCFYSRLVIVLVAYYFGFLFLMFSLGGMLCVFFVVCVRDAFVLGDLGGNFCFRVFDFVGCTVMCCCFCFAVGCLRWCFGVLILLYLWFVRFVCVSWFCLIAYVCGWLFCFFECFNSVGLSLVCCYLIMLLFWLFWWFVTWRGDLLFSVIALWGWF